MSETKAMDTTLYLIQEEKWGPWIAALKHLKYSHRFIRKLPLGGWHRVSIARERTVRGRNRAYSTCMASEARVEKSEIFDRKLILTAAVGNYFGESR